MTEYSYWNPEYQNLPILHNKADKMTDEDRDFDSDITYMRELLKDIADVLDFMGGEARPPFSSLELDIIEAELASIEVTR